jgi:ketosteroid isomerase-like protein
MSRENVELVRSMFEFFLASQGGSSFAPFLAAIETGPYVPDVEWDSREAEIVGIPDISGIYRGTDGIATFWREWLDAWESVQFEYELVEAGDCVVALIDQRMRGRSTHIEVSLGEYAHVFTFRDRLISRWKFYASQAAALEAVGLSE